MGCSTGRSHGKCDRGVLHGLQHARLWLSGVRLRPGTVRRAEAAGMSREAGGDRHLVLREVSCWAFSSRSACGGSTRRGAESGARDGARRPPTTSKLVAGEQPYSGLAPRALPVRRRTTRTTNAQPRTLNTLTARGATAEDSEWKFSSGRSVPRSLQGLRPLAICPRTSRAVSACPAPGAQRRLRVQRSWSSRAIRNSVSVH